MSAFDWTKQREEAVALLADDKLSDEEIARRIGVGERTFARWKKEPAFRVCLSS